MKTLLPINSHDFPTSQYWPSPYVHTTMHCGEDVFRRRDFQQMVPAAGEGPAEGGGWKDLREKYLSYREAFASVKRLPAAGIFPV